MASYQLFCLVALALITLSYQQLVEDAITTYFTTDRCDIPTTTVESCWLGVGAGYKGYYWFFSCRDKLIYEHQCEASTASVGCVACDDGWNWGEKADTCYSYNKEYYSYACIPQ